MLGEHADSVIVAHLERFRSFDSALRRRADVRPEEMFGLRNYAVQLGSTDRTVKDIGHYWGVTGSRTTVPEGNSPGFSGSRC